MINCGYSMRIACQLKKDISYINAQEVIGNIINEAHLYNKDIKHLHNINQFKGYCYSNFYPTEKDKTYKKGRIYTYELNSITKDTLEMLKLGIERVENPYFKVLCLGEIAIKRRRFIKQLYTFTPAIATVYENEKTQPFILQKHGLELLQNRITSNLLKKYKFFFNKDLKCENLIKGIEMTSNIPIPTAYKGKKLLGYKFTIILNDTYEAQELGRLAIATGILEKNSCLGSGFVNAH